MMLLRLLHALASVIVLASCGGQSDLPQDDGKHGVSAGGSSGTAPTPDANSEVLPPGPVKLPPFACTAEGDVVIPSSVDQFRSAMEGVWLACGDGPALPNVVGGSGVAFFADGVWRLVTVDADGNLAAGKGFDQQGTWEALDTSEQNGPGSYQLNIRYSTGAFFPTRAAFEPSIRKLRIGQPGFGTVVDYAGYP